MKIEKKMATVYLEQFDIHVNQYLPYAQIQNIVNSTLHLMNTVDKSKDGTEKKHNTWAERQQSIDMLVLLYATDLTKKQLSAPHVMFLQNGVIEAVRDNIKNYNQINEAFEYTDGMKATVLNVIGGLTTLLKHLNPKTLIKKEKDGAM